jgi:hypothetical protein
MCGRRRVGSRFVWKRGRAAILELLRVGPHRRRPLRTSLVFLIRLFPVQNQFVSHRFRPGCSVRLSCLVKSVTVFVLHILSSPHVEADRPTSTATKATAVAPYLRHRRMRVRSTTAMAPHIEADRPTSTANRARNIWRSGTSSRSSVRGRRRRLRRALIEPTARSRRCAAHTRPHRHLQDPRP